MCRGIILDSWKSIYKVSVVGKKNRMSKRREENQESKNIFILEHKMDIIKSNGR
jgi:hypothetical protein